MKEPIFEKGSEHSSDLHQSLGNESKAREKRTQIEATGKKEAYEVPKIEIHQVAVEREFGNFPTEEIIPRDEEEKIG